MSSTILITGSSGYVGSHIAKYFSTAGWRVVGLDKVAPPQALTKYLVAHEISDIAESHLVTKFCCKHHVQGVVHCAARCLVEESVRNPGLYHEENVIKANLLLDGVLKANVKSFLFSSTAAVYGNPTAIPISETHPRKPINPYGESKMVFENDLLKKAKEHNIAVGIFRYFNACGADPDHEIGETHDPETHLIPLAISAALGRRPCFDIFGTDYDTRDGTCERDFIHVWDLASAHLTLLDRMVHTQRGGIYNLGTGKGFTVKEVVDEIDRHGGATVSRTLKARRPGDPPILVADASRAHKELDWTPKFSDLQTVISTALAWHRTIHS